MNESHIFLRDYRRELRSSLGEFPDKIAINKLTYIAEDGLPFAQQLAGLFEEEIRLVSGTFLTAQAAI